MIAIIVAMGKELSLLLNLVDNIKETEINGFKFFKGQIQGRDIVAHQCGIGKVNAAIGTLTLIENFHPAAVVNSGVAGGTGHGAGILDVVLADRITYHDVWCGPGTVWGEASGCPRYFECPLDAKAAADAISAKCGLVASGDLFVSRVQDVERIMAMHPDTIAVDMESGAVAQTCYLKGVPMVCLRVVSDTPGQSDNIAQYENFWDDAPQLTFNAITKLLPLI